MYLWFGIDVDSQVQALKARTLEAEKRAAFRVQGSSLPMHISLKVPFPFSEEGAGKVLDAAARCFEGLAPFSVPVLGLENEHTIAWLRIAHSRELSRLHDALNTLLLRDFGVGLHEYDKDYKFHVSLLLEEDPRKVDLAFRYLRNASFPDRLRVDRICMGVSPGGGIGTYHVVRTLRLKAPGNG